MSTKIFHGYKTAPMGIQALIQAVNGLRQHERSVYVRDIADIFASAYDNDSVYSTEKPDKQKTILDIVHAKEKDKEKSSLAFIPYKDYFLFLVYPHTRRFTEQLEKESWVIPYPYWDNSDPDESCSEEEWEEREIVWEEALGWKAPSEVGFIFEFFSTPWTFGYHSQRGKVTFDDIEEFLPTFEERCSSMAWNICSINRLLKSHGKTQELKFEDMTREQIEEQLKGLLEKW